MLVLKPDEVAQKQQAPDVGGGLAGAAALAMVAALRQ
jgi:hypothetical protein